MKNLCTETNMAKSVLHAYKHHLYVPENSEDGGGTQQLLKYHPSVDGEEQQARLSELYFHLLYYGIDTNTGDDPPTFGESVLANFTFMPTSTGEISKSFRKALLSKLPADVTAVSGSWFTDHDTVDTWFSGVLKEACTEAAVVKTDSDTGVPVPQLALDRINTSFHRRYLLGEEVGENSDDLLATTRTSMNETYTNPSALRPYFAWKYIDIMFPGVERNEYFLIERVHLLTKLVFIIAMIHPKASTLDSTGATQLIEDHDKADVVLDIIGRAIVFIVKKSLVYTNIGDATTDLSIDDDETRNSELSHMIHNNSKTLIKNKDIVQKTQDNLRSLVNVDGYVKKTRTRAWYTMVVLLVLLGLVVGSMAFAYSRARTGEMYLIGGIVVLGVLAFEAFKGAERLFSLPASVFE